MPDTSFVPAQVFHPAEIIADECIARGWSIWDFAARIGALNEPQTVLAYELYALCDPDMLMGDDAPMDLERVFGISAGFWRRSEALVREHRDRIAPLSAEAHEWYGFDDEVDDTPALVERTAPPLDDMERRT